MNKKRSVSYIKPEDPEFLKILKKQAGYDDKNHKFDDLMNAVEDFVDDGDNEQPQVVVLKEGDLTAEEAEAEKKKIEQKEAETKADLTQKVIFKPKDETITKSVNKRKIVIDSNNKHHKKKSHQLLSFNEDDDDDENCST